MRGRPGHQPGPDRPARTIPAGTGPTRRRRWSCRCLADDPRGCGADADIDTVFTLLEGQSPRVRGRQLGDPARPARHGTIPAGAGPTPRPASWPRRGADDPRGCGADVTSRRGESSRTGRSPRVRGRRTCSTSRWRSTRTIPAGAGPTGRRRASRCRSWDDPRGCRADAVRAYPRSRHPGRSPRVRGRPPLARGADDGDGTIPAGAGPTKRPSRATSRTTDDPRGCGADGAVVLRRLGLGGRSPQVRGRRGSSPPFGLSSRTIPAGAGPTRHNGRAQHYQQDDPRGYGAEEDLDDEQARTAGRSPRVQGRRSLMSLAINPARTIPAGAGPTFSRPVAWSTDSDDPRGCGADGPFGRQVEDAEGRSPRVRGRRRLRAVPDGRRRTIPAGAGPTRVRGVCLSHT